MENLDAVAGSVAANVVTTTLLDGTLIEWCWNSVGEHSNEVVVAAASLYTRTPMKRLLNSLWRRTAM